MRLSNFLIYVLTLTMILAFGAWVVYVGKIDESKLQDQSTLNNGLWVRQSWVDSDQDWTRISDFAMNFKGRNIDNIYVYLGGLDEGGKLPEYRYIYARQFIQRIKTISPNLKVFFWLDLDGENLMANQDDLLALSHELVEKIGFDGIQFKLEKENLPAYLELMMALNKEEFIEISVIVENFQSNLVNKTLGQIYEIEAGINDSELMNIDKFVDELVVILQKPELGKSELAEWVVRENLVAVTRSLSHSKLKVAISASLYLSSEFKQILDQVYLALANTRSQNENFSGLIFSHWLMTANNWNDLDLFLKKFDAQN